MIIKILGSGYANCKRLEANARQALDTLGLQATVEKVTDFGQTASYGVMRTPGLVVDEQVLVSGRVPDATEIAALLRPRPESAAGRHPKTATLAFTAAGNNVELTRPSRRAPAPGASLRDCLEPVGVRTIGPGPASPVTAALATAAPATADNGELEPLHTSPPDLDHDDLGMVRRRARVSHGPDVPGLPTGRARWDDGPVRLP